MLSVGVQAAATRGDLSTKAEPWEVLCKIKSAIFFVNLKIGRQEIRSRLYR